MTEEQQDYFQVVDPHFFHPPGSPYLGLSLKEQKVLAKIRRPKGRTPKGILMQMRNPRKEDYQKLVLACSQALIYGGSENVERRMDRLMIYLRLPFNFRRTFKKSFPRIYIEAYDDWSIFCKMNINKLMDWLYKEGHSQYTANELRKSLWAINREQEKADFIVAYGIDTGLIELYADVIDDVKKLPKAEKGRRHYRKKKLDSPSEICSNNVSAQQGGSPDDNVQPEDQRH